MWATRDVVLMTVAVATLTIIVTILANRKLNDMIDAKASQRSAIGTNTSPMLSVLGNMKQGPVYRETRDIPTSEIPVSSETEPSPAPVQSPPPVASKPEEKPQGAGARWTPL